MILKKFFIKYLFQIGAKHVDLKDLAVLSDIVIVTASLNESTSNIVNKQFFANMKKSSYLVNVSRGGLVNQDDLITALKTGQIKGFFCFLSEIKSKMNGRLNLVTDLSKFSD